MTSIERTKVMREMEQPERGFTLAEILGHDKGDSPEAELCRIWLDLFYSGAEYEDKLLQLPAYDRYIWLVCRFSREVDNGGIDQFLFNASGDYVVETLEALAAIGASKAHRALKRACDLFPSGRPSEDCAIREEQVRQIHAKAGRPIDELISSDDIESNLTELLLDFRRRNAPPS